MVDRRVDLDRAGDGVGRGERVDRALVAETTPTANEVSWPNGLPIAATGSPTTTRLESPSGSGATAWSSGSTFTSPVSLKRSQPTMDPECGRRRRRRRRPRRASNGRTAVACVRDHVRVREDVPGRRDDEARPCERCPLPKSRGVDRDDTAGTTGVDPGGLEAVADQRRRRAGRALTRRRLDRRHDDRLDTRRRRPNRPRSRSRAPGCAPSAAATSATTARAPARIRTG